MKRRIVVISGLLVLLAFGSFLGAYFFFKDSITQGACAAIKEGMTEADVIRILGKSCGRTQPFLTRVQEVNPDGSVRMVVLTKTRKTWNGNAGSISVDFAEAGFVESSWFEEGDNSVWRKVRRALRLEEEQPLPSPPLLQSPPQYIPPSEVSPLPTELQGVKEATKPHEDNLQPK
jgi:hypothetical protein